MTVLSAPLPPPGRRWLSAIELLSAVTAGASFVAVWPMVLAARSGAPLQLPVLIAHVCGMLAGYGVLVLILMMSRSPALERGVGADVLARWHARGGRAVLTLVLVHAGAAVVAWEQSRGESLRSATWQVLRLPWLMGAAVGTLMLVVVAVISMRAARRRLSHEAWHGLHLLTYIAVGLGFLHQLAGPDLAGHRPVQIGWALLFTHVYALVLRHRVLAPLRAATRHRMRVARVVPEAPGVVSIEIVGDHLAELGAEPGQFLRWRFLTPDHWRTAHPFSLSAPPTADRLRLTVKALGQGSARLQAIAPGTWVVAEGPYGAMTAARRTCRDVLLIAGGVGITPMRALFETLPIAPGGSLILLYRARSLDHVVFRRELERIAWTRGARLHYLLGDDPTCLSPARLTQLVPDAAQRDVYLCGPAGMAAAVRDALRVCGLPVGRLHEESFAF